MGKLNTQKVNNLLEEEKSINSEIISGVSCFLKENLENNTEGLKENGEISIKSPTRGENYKLSQVLSKGFERSELACDSLEYKKLHRCFYGSIDGVVEVENLRCSSSIWTDSADFSITGKIPVHFTENGRMSIGFGCGCDSSYGGQYPSQSDPDNEDWDLYKKEIGPLAKIYISCGDKNQEISLEDAINHHETDKILRDLLFEAIAVKKLLS